MGQHTLHLLPALLLPLLGSPRLPVAGAQVTPLEGGRRLAVTVTSLAGGRRGP